MKRIVFLNRFFFPDHSATSQILTDLAFYLASVGREVHVVTSRQRYDDPQAGLPLEETAAGVHIHRVSTTHFGRSGLVGRGLEYLSFYRSTWRLLLRIATPGDILVAMTDPPLISVLARRAAQRSDAVLVNWLQDLYPEIAIELGVPLFSGPLGQRLLRLRNRSLRAAAGNVVVGHRMADKLFSYGMAKEHVQVIPNWVDDVDILPISTGENPLRTQWGLEGKFVIGYSGNLGRAHEFKTLLAASEKLAKNSRIAFLFIGGGHQAFELSQSVSERGLSDSFRFIPYQPREMLKYSLSAPDVHWISLKPALEGLIVPSKFYGIAAVGRPIIAVTAKDGEIARLLQHHDCGLVIEPGNAAELADTILALSVHMERVHAMGRRARAMLETEFSRDQALQRWQRVLDSIG
jgi:colanic acid biosynthesis glycosyl transferase WcaI